MKSNINTKLNQMSATELKEIIDNSYLYDAEIVDKAKELLAVKNTQPVSVDETTTKAKAAPVNKKGVIIAGVSVIVVLVAVFSVLFGIRANNSQKYVLVEETHDVYFNTYEYEFDFLNRITKRYTYMDSGELESVAFYDKNENIYEQQDSDGNTFYKAEYKKGKLVKKTTTYSNGSSEIATLKSTTEHQQEWSIETDEGKGIYNITLNSQGDAVETTYGDTKICFEHEYNNNGNKIKSVLSAFMNGEKIQPDSATYYTYMTVEEYQKNIQKNSNDKTLEIKPDKSSENVMKKEDYVAFSNEGLKEANKKQNDNETKNTLRISTNAEFEPFEFMKNGEMVGFDIDLMTDLCNRMGYQPEFINVDFGSVMPFVYNDKADCGIAAITITEERKANVDFTDIYISAYIDYGGDMCLEELAIAVKKGSPLKNKLNVAIQEAITDGTIDALVEKWNIDTINN